MVSVRPIEQFSPDTFTGSTGVRSFVVQQRRPDWMALLYPVRLALLLLLYNIGLVPYVILFIWARCGLIAIVARLQLTRRTNQLCCGGYHYFPGVLAQGFAKLWWKCLENYPCRSEQRSKSDTGFTCYPVRRCPFSVRCPSL